KKEREVAPNHVNRVCAETQVVGDTVTNSDMRIDGSYEGNIISSGRLVIGETGQYKGAVQCRFLDVWGRYTGTVEASDVVSFKTGAIFDGEVRTAKLMMELGVVFNGNCTMQEDLRPKLEQS
ncbi:MAG: polymer-forming cytoskeletal protein, partial [Bacteroidales bacterium]|nr:polymer-forming cytoskeletal protein [Bacteroidales bacterium]